MLEPQTKAWQRVEWKLNSGHQTLEGEGVLGGVHPSIERLQFAPIQSVAAIAHVAKLSASVLLVVDEGENCQEPLTKSGEKRLGKIVAQVIDYSSFKDTLEQLDHSHHKTFHVKP